MRSIRLFFVAIMCTVPLASCVLTGPPSPIAAEESQRDGRILEAKPGLGRIYIVHGNYLPAVGVVPTSPCNTTAIVPSGGGLLGAFIGGVVVGVVQGAVKASDGCETRSSSPGWVVNPNNHDYFVDGVLVGTMGGRQYMSFDLAPGDYVLSIGTPGKGPLRVSLDAGTVQMAMSVNKEMFWCASDCKIWIEEGQRVVANWPVQAPAQK